MWNWTHFEALAQGTPNEVDSGAHPENSGRLPHSHCSWAHPVALHIPELDLLRAWHIRFLASEQMRLVYLKRGRVGYHEATAQMSGGHISASETHMLLCLSPPSWRVSVHIWSYTQEGNARKTLEYTATTAGFREFKGSGERDKGIQSSPHNLMGTAWVMNMKVTTNRPHKSIFNIHPTEEQIPFFPRKQGSDSGSYIKQG